jgi:hypothetical protein
VVSSIFLRARNSEKILDISRSFLPYLPSFFPALDEHAEAESISHYQAGN